MTELNFFESRQQYVFESNVFNQPQLQFICRDTFDNLDKFVDFCNRKEGRKTPETLRDWWGKFKKSKYYQR